MGHTVEKAVIDLGRSEATAGLTFLWLSQAKRLMDLFVGPKLFDRRSIFGVKPALKLRLGKRTSSKPWRSWHISKGVDEGGPELFRRALCIDLLTTVGVKGGDGGRGGGGQRIKTTTTAH